MYYFILYFSIGIIYTPNGRLISKDIKRKQLRNPRIPLPIRMQIITTLQRIRQLTRIRLVPQPLIEVQHLIKGSTLPNPLIDPLSRLLPLWIAIPLDRDIVPRCAERRDGCSENRDIECLNADGYLGECCDETIANGLLGCGVCGASPDVVYALEDHGVFDS